MSNKPEESASAGTHLDKIPTRWSLLRLAHRDTLSLATEARNALVLRYARAIRHFVGKHIPGEQDADEVAQDVVVRLLSGQFASADPSKGSFRRMLMVAAHNLVRTWWARQKRRAGADVDLTGVADEPQEHALEQEGLSVWRNTLLEHAWKALQEHEESHPGTLSFTVLKMRARHPDDDSETLARRIAERIGKPYRADALRQQLRRARLRFAEFLLEEIAQGLDDPSPGRVEEELVDTGLMPYVQDLLPPDWRTRGELVSEE